MTSDGEDNGLEYDAGLYYGKFWRIVEYIGRPEFDFIIRIMYLGIEIRQRFGEFYHQYIHYFWIVILMIIINKILLNIHKSIMLINVSIISGLNYGKY